MATRKPRKPRKNDLPADEGKEPQPDRAYNSGSLERSDAWDDNTDPRPNSPYDDERRETPRSP